MKLILMKGNAFKMARIRPVLSLQDLADIMMSKHIQSMRVSWLPTSGKALAESSIVALILNIIIMMDTFREATDMDKAQCTSAEGITSNLLKVENGSTMYCKFLFHLTRLGLINCSQVIFIL